MSYADEALMSASCTNGANVLATAGESEMQKLITRLDQLDTKAVELRNLVTSIEGSVFGEANATEIRGAQSGECALGLLHVRMDAIEHAMTRAESLLNRFF